MTDDYIRNAYPTVAIHHGEKVVRAVRFDYRNNFLFNLSFWGKTHLIYILDTLAGRQ
jgi:hypothetical protein